MRVPPELVDRILAHAAPALDICGTRGGGFEGGGCARDAARALMRSCRAWRGLLAVACLVASEWHAAAQPRLSALLMPSEHGESEMETLGACRRSRSVIRTVVLGQASTRAMAMVLMTCPSVTVMVIDRLCPIVAVHLALPALRDLDVHEGEAADKRAICAAAPNLRRLRLGPSPGGVFAEGVWPDMPTLRELDVRSQNLEALLRSRLDGLARLELRGTHHIALARALNAHASSLPRLERLGIDVLFIDRTFVLARIQLPPTVRVLDACCGSDMLSMPAAPGAHLNRVVADSQDMLTIVGSMLQHGRWRQLDALNVSLAPRMTDAKWPGNQAAQTALDDIRARCIEQSIVLTLSSWSRGALVLTRRR